jgi:uncharacterized protein YkwD
VGVSFDRVLAYAVGVLSAVLVITILTTQGAPQQVGPDRTAAAYMLDLVNEVRLAEGLAPLEAANDIAEVAERWSAEMANDRYMRHNPAFAEEICCWQLATENVAWSEPHRLWRPGDPVLRITDELHAALLDSPSHRDNLLDASVDQVGIGVYVDRDGNVWITQNFRRSRID